MNNEINDKISKINLLISNDLELNKYINDIENLNIDIPSNLEYSLLNKFSSKTTKPKNIFIENSIKILKIATCTIFVLIIWNVTPTSINTNIHEQSSKVNINAYENINNKFKNFSELLLTPINIERNDK